MANEYEEATKEVERLRTKAVLTGEPVVVAEQAAD